MPLAEALLLLLSGAAPAPAFSPRALWEAWPERRFVATAPRACATPSSASGCARSRPPTRAAVARERRPLGRGPAIQLLTRRPRPAPRAALVADARRRALGDAGARSTLADYLLADATSPSAAGSSSALTLLHDADAQPRRRRALPAAQRAGDRPQSRRAAAWRRRRGPAQGACATATSRSSASTCTTRTAVRPWATRGVLATIALLAVAGDAAGTVTPGRAARQRACAALVARARAVRPGGIARYDEDWNPRAFGDNLTAWGTPVVLIESGGLPRRAARSTDLTRLNFVGLLSVLRGPRARTTSRGHDSGRLRGARRATRRPPSRTSSLDGGRVLQAPAAEPYRADLAFDVPARTPSGLRARPRGGRSVADPRGRRRAVAGRGEPPRRAGARAAPRARRLGARDRRAFVAQRGVARRDQPSRRGQHTLARRRVRPRGGASRRGGSRRSRADRNRSGRPPRPRPGDRDPLAAGRAAFAA